MKKNKKFLLVALVSCLSIQSFASDIQVAKKESSIQENHNDLDDFYYELEEIDKNAEPSYKSRIFFSLPFGVGLNFSIKDNEKVGDEKYNTLGSNNWKLACLVNFPIFAHHLFLSTGLECGLQFLQWDGNKNFKNTKLFKADNLNEIFAKVQKDGISSSTFSFYRAGILGKLSWAFDKLDPTDGFFISILGGIHFNFCPSLTKLLTSAYNGVSYRTSAKREILGLNLFNKSLGLEIGYQRFSIFYTQFFNPIFDHNVINSKEICSFPFCVGINFNLL